MKSSDDRKKVGQGAAGDLEAEVGPIRIPRGMQLDVNVDCGCERVDIVDIDVEVFPLSTTCESGLAVAERRAPCEAAGQLWREERAEEERTCVCSAVEAGCAERQH